MKRYILACLLIVLLAPSVFAAIDDIPINIKADELKYGDNTSIVEASGSVEVEFKSTKIFADYLQMDSVSNLITAEGHVRLIDKEYSIKAASLTYDASLEIAAFADVITRATPSNLKGSLYIDAKKLTDVGNKMTGGPAGVTTCDRLEPHFYLEGKEINYFPNDHLEGTSVTFYTGNSPVLWLPFLYYDLKKKNSKNWVYGHNDVEGDFFKTTWAYPLGILFLDSMEKKGFGLGTEVGYGLAALGVGSLYVYQQKEKDTGINNWVTRLSDTKQLDPNTVLSFNHRYSSTYQIPSGRIEQTAFGFNLNRKTAASWNLKFDLLDDRGAALGKYALQFNNRFNRQLSNYYASYDFSKQDPQWLRKTQRFNYSSPFLSDNITFNTSTNYYHSTTQAGDSGQERIEPQIELRGSEKDYSWRYAENWFIDLRQDLYPGVPQYEFLEKQPEIEIYPKALDLKILNLQSTIGYGSYREVKSVPQLGKKRDYTTDRYRTTLNASQGVALGWGSSLNLTAGIDQYLYGPGDQLFAYRESGTLSSNPWPFFRNELAYRKSKTDGNTPFFFDRLGGDYHDGTERLTFYYLDKFNWSTTGGYNWQTHKWFDVMTSLSASPDKSLSGQLSTGWDIENTIYKDLVASCHYGPKSYFSLDLSVIQNMNIGQLKSGSALYNMTFLENQPNQLNLRFSQVYDANTKEFRVRDIMMVKQLDCWEMKYNYSDYLKQFSLVFSLKAMPGEPIGYASGRGFYFDGFEKELKQYKTEGAVNRY